MNKQELTQALEKAKRQLSLAKEQDEKDFAEKKIAKLEKELSEMEEKPKEEPKKKDEPKEKPKAEPKAKTEPKPKQDKPKAKSETVADKLMAIDGDVWDELNIKSGSQLYADLKLQEKYKKALNNAIMDDAEKIPLPLAQGVFDALEGENYHSLNQHLTLMGMFGAKKRTDWLDFLSKNDTKSVLDKSIYEKVSGKPKPKTRSGDDEDYCHELIEREEGAKKSGYDLDELLRSAKERKAKSKKRAQDRKDAPKKTPATKDRERVSKTNEAVVKGVMKRAEQGKVTAIEVEKLIAEHEEAIEDLQKVLAKLKAKKMRRGGGVGEEFTNEDLEEIVGDFSKEQYDNFCYNYDIDFENGQEMSNFIYGLNKNELNHIKKQIDANKFRRGGRTTGTDKKRDAMFDAKDSGKRKSSKVAYVDMKSGGYYERRNANQYGKTKGGGTYYESAKNRSDKGKWK